MRNISLLLLCLLPFPAFAQTMEGLWLSGEWEGARSVIEVAPCDDGLCGIIVEMRGGEAQDGRIGHRIMWGFEDQGNGRYSKGKLKPPGGAPQLGAKITSISENEMIIRACLLMICRNETMTRL